MQDTDTSSAAQTSNSIAFYLKDEYLRDIEPSEPEQVPDWLADLDDQSSITGGTAGDLGEL